ncbi:histidine phosphatase family protein [Thalassospira mesophila]|uniref:Phosphoglycerate mutase n=1 Tax=Thalassospira mesophila TaxID=1293891 RepID=A0A1Y2L143_9PROT|nr:histidine phosphatase family protein [Thalassospira mesophila]OSQ38950.1 phosphoglycerate mutase [Thalassospira mesophila]
MPDFSFALLRHGATSWNVEGRIQGHSDIGLLPETRSTLATFRVPAPWSDMPWYTSPLKRTVQTALALGVSPVGMLPAFIEMNWGVWEGQHLATLRATLGAEMTRNEDRGPDFRPDGGESPRDVIRRVEAFLAQWSGGDFGVIAHKGVIRAIYARAAGWDMMGKIPDKLHWDALHVFHWSAKNGLSVKQLNIPLLANEGAPQ